jgi:lysophospholipase L1-like esterase
MKRIKQILFILVINGVILTVGIVIIELVFGGWLNPNKLNRLHLLPNCKREYNVSRLYKTAHPIIKYTRDEYGLRGHYSDPSDIDILTVGGSATDQKYIRDGETWQDVLQQQFNRQGVSVVVANAGVNGQSTFGHIKNFEWWFPFIPHLAPSFILFYVGINDFHKDYKDDGRAPDVLLSSNTKYIKKSIKANSAIAHLGRTLYGTYKSMVVYKISHRSIDFNKVSWTRDALQKDYEFMQPRLNAYAKRLRVLADLTFASGAKPIFVTQPSRKYRTTSGGIEGIQETSPYDDGHQYNGVDYYHMMKRLDSVTKAVAIEKNAYFVDLSSYANWEDIDFYDFAHLTPPGAYKVGTRLYHAIKDIIVDAKTQKVRKE